MLGSPLNHEALLCFARAKQSYAGEENLTVDTPDRIAMGLGVSAFSLLAEAEAARNKGRR